MKEKLKSFIESISWKDFIPLYFWTVSILIWDLALHCMCYRSFSESSLSIFPFILVFALVMTLIFRLFSEKLNFILTLIFTILMTLSMTLVGMLLGGAPLSGYWSAVLHTFPWLCLAAYCSVLIFLPLSMKVSGMDKVAGGPPKK